MAIVPKVDSGEQAGKHSGVGARTAEQAVLELLGKPVREPALVGGSQEPPARPLPARPWSADTDTVEILKQRDVLGRRLYVVSFTADHCRHGSISMTMLVRADRFGKAWVARLMTGASGIGDAAPTQPHVNLAGSWGRHGFCGGGKVQSAGADVTAVRVRFANGIELEDDATAGWVLFFTDSPVERPSAVVELLDRDGAVAASHDWPWSPELPELLRSRIQQG
jgi:hypothetical protein